MSSITDNVTKVNFVNGSTTTTDLDLVKVNLNGTIYYKYVKAYTYNKNVNYTRPGYDWDFRCYRSSSPYKGASTGLISDGGTIYYGDVIYFTVNSDLKNAGVTLSTSKPQSSPLTVTGNVNASSYISIVKAAGRVWLMGYGDADPNAITTVYARVDNGSWVQYNNLPYDDMSVTVQGNVYFDSAIDVYDVPSAGYTARYTQSSPLRINLERDYTYINEGVYHYIYQALPATCAYQFVKNTGVNKIYYRNGTSGNWTELSSTTTVNFNYNSTVQWYATAVTGYTRNDSYTSSSNYQTFTVTAKKTISPAATLNTYAVSVSKGTGIDRIYYKTSSSGSYSYTTSNLSLTLNHGTYFAWYATAATGYNLTSAYTSSNPYTNSGITSALSFSATASLKTYTLTITKNTGVATIYYKVNGASSWSSTTSSKTVSVNHGSNIYWYATAASGYTRDDNYTSSSSYATISNVTSAKTISPTATSSSIEYTICIAAITAGVIAPYYICSDVNDYENLVAPGGLGSYVVSEFQVYVTRDASLHTVWAAQSQINNELPPEYTYSGGNIECPCDPNNPYVYLGVYVEYNDH